MLILKKNDNIKKYNEKKSYRQPQLKEIGKVYDLTKGSGSEAGLDFSFPFLAS
ncbi:hypothetical protein MN086_09470 [Sulfurovum sp. XGS-02]|uniref:hypothetical protein n=1 Tax=Sulfurovum sp. XGS-02 TaxID=2925411 RepID=UPI0020553304|nr:hypothetical protein [Sulfurovum sp. XGS-02]UPT77276.1 hypothetical protein MN086_09470 [Sulfurovum sp. XGS-02]